MTDPKNELICGVVMPISAVDGCTESHWSDVQDIISQSITDAGFFANLVSNADEAGIIHKTIIQNLYDNPIVVCDVSGKNPNVMFELGLRLAFDKPTIIVKDDKTSYSFDTAAIEHLEYPRDLRFTKIVAFKEKLRDKIKATHTKATTDPNYTTFLKHFGEFTVAKLDKREVPGQEFILEELRGLRASMARLGVRGNTSEEFISYGNRNRGPRIVGDVDVCMEGSTDDEALEVAGRLRAHAMVNGVRIDRSRDHKHLVVDLLPGADGDEIRKLANAGRRSSTISLGRRHGQVSEHVKHKNSETPRPPVIAARRTGQIGQL